MKYSLQEALRELKEEAYIAKDIKSHYYRKGESIRPKHNITIDNILSMDMGNENINRHNKKVCNKLLENGFNKNTVVFDERAVYVIHRALSNRIEIIPINDVPYDKNMNPITKYDVELEVYDYFLNEPL